jgi:TetR/AcrR family transcriptional regulator, transcriptional repressor for nem operon
MLRDRRVVSGVGMTRKRIRLIRPDRSSIGDLEVRTGLDRSSIYHAFGNKHTLFEAALRCYVEENIDARLGGMRQADASLASVVTFFAGMAQAFSTEPRAARGCLIVNTIAELGSRDPHAVRAATDYRDRFREAFAAALSRPRLRERSTESAFAHAPSF